MSVSVRVLGAGIIGLSVAEELLHRGHAVEVVDPAPGTGASYAAAGMLSPSGEIWHGEEALFALGVRSLVLWPDFAARLGVPLLRTGTLLAGADASDVQEVDRQLELLREHGVRAEPLGSRALRSLEPRLAHVAGGACLPDDHSVDPRRVVAALLDRVSVVPEATGSADAVVVATGSRLPAPYTGLVRGVRGEILRLRCDDPPAQVVRGLVHGEHVYVVPRAGDREVVVGATSEEHDAEPVATVEAVRRLLDAACRLMPGLDRAEFREATARDRPATPDNLPLIGPAEDGANTTVLAAGHYRNGVLLAPLTARLVADHLETGTVEHSVDPRRLTRERNA